MITYRRRSCARAADRLGWARYPAISEHTPVQLSVIIVTWDGLRYLPACLEALAPQLPADGEIVVVDNGSCDGTAAWLRASHPAARLLALPENIGFAGGVNAGLRAARGELLLLANNDAFCQPGFVQSLLGAARAQPEIGAFGAVLTFNHRPDLVASAGVRLRADGVALDLWAERPVAELPDAPQPIFGVSGGAALYRRTMLTDIGLMEPSFFNYLEDVDLALRARLRGWESAVVPTALARHIYSASGVQGSALKQRLLARNRLRALVRCLPKTLLLRCLPQIMAYDLAAAAYGLASGRRAMASGRREALSELPQLLVERLAIQAARTAPVSAIGRWIEPVPPPWATLAAQRRLDALLRQRV